MRERVLSSYNLDTQHTLVRPGAGRPLCGCVEFRMEPGSLPVGARFLIITMTSNTEATSYKFAIDMHRLKALGIVDPKSRAAHEAFDQHDLSSAERLFFKLWGNDSLKSGVFQPGQNIAEKGEHPVFAHVVISGEVISTDESGSHLLGPGSVFGLAEGLADITYQWDAVAKTVVTTRLIPVDRALREVRRLNAGLKGICRFTTMRVLNLPTAPESLK